MSEKKVVTSIRGEKVDFDLMRIKNDMASIPETETVKYRENLIQSRRKRKNASRRKVKDMLSQQHINEAAIRKALEKKNKDSQPQLVEQQPLENEKVEAETQAEVKLNRKVKVKNNE
jgi:hypothetical protein